MKRIIIEVDIYQTAVGAAFAYQNRGIQAPLLSIPPLISSISARFLPWPMFWSLKSGTLISTMRTLQPFSQHSLYRVTVCNARFSLLMHSMLWVIPSRL
jgi:hypothetical protein